VLEELRGFEPMAIASAVRSQAIPPFADQCAQLLAARAFSIAIDALASVALLWRRSQASLRWPRYKVDRRPPNWIENRGQGWLHVAGNHGCAERRRRRRISRELQRPLPDELLRIVARGEKEDPPPRFEMTGT
jgi:hypothetical protein